jgi:hypothetical protein
MNARRYSDITTCVVILTVRPFKKIVPITTCFPLMIYGSCISKRFENPRLLSVELQRERENVAWHGRFSQSITQTGATSLAACV